MNQSSCILTCVGTAILLSLGTVRGQILGPDFLADYRVRDLGPAADVPPLYGGLRFKANDPTTLLVGGNANDPAATICQLQVIRDAQNHISGFATACSHFADAPGIPPVEPLDVEGGIDGGLDYGPDAVLFYTSAADGAISQILPGGTSPARQTRLRDLGIDDARGGLAFVPAGFPGAGRLKIAGWSSQSWCDAAVTPDGNGLFHIGLPSTFVSVVPYASGLVYVKGGQPPFAKDSVLITSQMDDRVVVYEVDTNGDPVPETRRDLLTDFYQVRGATLDPLTGDILLTTADFNDPRVVLVGRLNVAATQVQIISPTEGATYTAPATFPVRAEASQTGGAIVRVDFYLDSTLIGSPAQAPYAALADSVTSGSHTFTAVAIDGGGNATTSAPVHISVVDYGPQLSLISPTNNAVLEACSDLKLVASVQAGSSDIAAVEFFRDTVKLGIASQPSGFSSYVWTERDLDEGTRVYWVTATDRNGLTAVAAATNVVVRPLPLHKLVLHHDEPGELRLCFKGIQDASYIWESADDPSASLWTPWTTNTAPAGRLQVTLPFEPARPQRFFRTRGAN